MAFLRAAPSTRPYRVDGIDRGEHGAMLGLVSDLARRKRTIVRVGDFELLVIFHRKRFTVVENRCPHVGAALDDAHVTRRTLTCAVHSYRYPLAGGACVSGPPYRAVRGGCLRPLPIQEVDGWLYAGVPEAG